MNQAINAYYTITASPEFQELERLRERAGHDEAQALYHAKQVSREETLLSNLKTLMETLGCTTEQAMDLLKVAPETRLKLARQL